MNRDDAKLSELNRKTFAAEDHSSRDELAPHLTDDFKVARGNWEIENKEQMLTRVAADKSGRTRRIDEESVHIWDTSGVVTSRLTLLERDGTAVGRFWNTKVCVKQGDGWKCLAWQVARIP
jgi:hypothetical protein